MGILDKAVVTALGLLFCGLGVTGCGTPGAPQPPSLQLPEPVADLAAMRAGDEVTLHWTMPKKTTDHLLIVGPVEAVVCRREVLETHLIEANCAKASAVSLASGEKGTFQETLPEALTGGAARQVIYFVELRNRNGHSAGLSKGVVVLAGAAPARLIGLSAAVRADGVALHWTGNGKDSVRVHRRLLKTSAEKPKGAGLMSAPIEPEIRDLFVETAGAQKLVGALDSTARFGQSYEYTAQRVESVNVDGRTLELAGVVSDPLQVAVVDTFPPAVPSGLAAVFVAEEKTIDLSWQPDSEDDLAGYIVVREEAGGDWKRISPAQPLPGPAFRDTTVEAGRSYRYAVSAIDFSGHESERSAEATESVPNP